MEDVAALLSELVAFDTTSMRPTEPVVAWLEDRCAALGAETRRVPGEEAGKLGLLVRFGPPAGDGVVLSAHLDCVPADGEAWASDPFDLDLRDGRLYGRGAADMKGFVAASLAAAARADRAALRRPVVLALSRDEELGTLGAPDLVAALTDWLPAPRAAIVGEPTSMDVVRAHKGVRSFETVVTGVDAHSSQPQRAANAVTAAARMVSAIDELADAVAAGPRDDAFEPPHTTFNPATIRGGQAINIVPRRCVLEWEYRPVPADDSFELRDRILARVEEEILPRLRRHTGEGSITTESTAVVPTLQVEDDGPAERLVRALLGTDAPARTVAFGTDGGHLQRAGISTIVCGPGSIDQAHRADEYVAVEQLRRAVDLIEGVFDRQASDAPAPG